jgi:hypothetical protein
VLLEFSYYPLSAEYTKTFVLVNEKIRRFEKNFQNPPFWPEKRIKKGPYTDFASCPTVIEQKSIVVETHRMDYNILPYKHLATKRMMIQHLLTSCVRIKTVMGMAKNTVLSSLNLFRRNSKKPYTNLK